MAIFLKNTLHTLSSLLRASRNTPTPLQPSFLVNGMKEQITKVHVSSAKCFQNAETQLGQALQSLQGPARSAGRVSSLLENLHHQATAERLCPSAESLKYSVRGLGISVSKANAGVAAIVGGARQLPHVDLHPTNFTPNNQILPAEKSLTSNDAPTPVRWASTTPQAQATHKAARVIPNLCFTLQTIPPGMQAALRDLEKIREGWIEAIEKHLKDTRQIEEVLEDFGHSSERLNFATLKSLQALQQTSQNSNKKIAVVISRLLKDQAATAEILEQLKREIPKVQQEMGQARKQAPRYHAQEILNSAAGGGVFSLHSSADQVQESCSRLAKTILRSQEVLKQRDTVLSLVQEGAEQVSEKLAHLLPNPPSKDYTRNICEQTHRE